jgi:thiamine-phosphate pyrophosphorylase
MTWKKKLLSCRGLYLVTDKKALKGRDMIHAVSRSLDAGVEIIQFRDKESSDRDFFETGKKIKKLTEGKKVLFIVNDRVDMAVALGADGVHLGQDDIPVEKAREALGKNKIIGLSTHSLEQIREAAEKGLDYVAVGPVFATPTKPGYKAVGLELVAKAKKELNIPVVGIGGINESNINEVMNAGADKAAIVRAVLSADDPFEAAKKLMMSFP